MRTAPHEHQGGRHSMPTATDGHLGGSARLPSRLGIFPTATDGQRGGCGRVRARNCRARGRTDDPGTRPHVLLARVEGSTPGWGEVRTRRVGIPSCPRSVRARDVCARAPLHAMLARVEGSPSRPQPVWPKRVGTLPCEEGARAQAEALNARDDGKRSRSRRVHARPQGHRARRDRTRARACAFRADELLVRARLGGLRSSAQTVRPRSDGANASADGKPACDVPTRVSRGCSRGPASPRSRFALVTLDSTPSFRGNGRRPISPECSGTSRSSPLRSARR
jgi:hypothetical protein